MTTPSELNYSGKLIPPHSPSHTCMTHTGDMVKYNEFTGEITMTTVVHTRPKQYGSITVRAGRVESTKHVANVVPDNSELQSMIACTAAGVVFMRNGPYPIYSRFPYPK